MQAVGLLSMSYLATNGACAVSNFVDVSTVSLATSSILLVMIGSGYLEISNITTKIGTIVSASLICIVSSYIAGVSLKTVIVTILLVVVSLRFCVFLIENLFTEARWASYGYQCTSENASEKSSKISSEGASETSYRVASETYSEGASETPSRVASETYSEGASETYSEGASETYSEGASETYSEGASETYSEGASETPSRVASETSSRVASETYSEGASETPSRVASETTSRRRSLRTNSGRCSKNLFRKPLGTFCGRSTDHYNGDSFSSGRTTNHYNGDSFSSRQPPPPLIWTRADMELQDIFSNFKSHVCTLSIPTNLKCSVELRESLDTVLSGILQPAASKLSNVKTKRQAASCLTEIMRKLDTTPVKTSTSCDLKRNLNKWLIKIHPDKVKKDGESVKEICNQFTTAINLLSKCTYGS